MRRHWKLAVVIFFQLAMSYATAYAPSASAADDQTRPAAGEDQLRRWLENMAWHHNYTFSEMQQVTGLARDVIEKKLQEFNISDATRPKRNADQLFVLPYPGGRHPRIGFLDGAIGPQRETKLSVFCPWDQESYVVLDVPEAIWSNLGLTYLAHTHIDTVWTKQNVTLQQQEWVTADDGSLSSVRRLPNGIEFGVAARPKRDHLEMTMRLSNGTDQLLSDLRVQNCVMLKGARGFAEQTNENKMFTRGYAVARSSDHRRWIISGWDPLHRVWGNAPCPCLHSDPKFPDCPPGETQWLRGWFSFYQGPDIEAELTRIEGTGWRTRKLQEVTGNVRGSVIDAATGSAIPSRLYVKNLVDGRWHFAASATPNGTAVRYEWPEIERDENGFTEAGWTEYGFQTSYALLNCGFRMRVSAGTASGVHPVPLATAAFMFIPAHRFLMSNGLRISMRERASSRRDR